jgi:hypothetical protein
MPGLAAIDIVKRWLPPIQIFNIQSPGTGASNGLPLIMADGYESELVEEILI